MILPFNFIHFHFSCSWSNILQVAHFFFSLTLSLCLGNMLGETELPNLSYFLLSLLFCLLFLYYFVNYFQLQWTLFFYMCTHRKLIQLYCYFFFLHIHFRSTEVCIGLHAVIYKIHKVETVFCTIGLLIRIPVDLNHLNRH